MPAAATRTPDPQHPSRPRQGEWFWRFLAVLMLAVVGWVVWIAIQISPPEIILPAAYEAAAKARARQNAAGAIGGSPAQPEAGSARTPAMPAAEEAPYVPPSAPPVDPPVNVDKLKFADSITTPILERPPRAGKSAADATR